MNEIVSHYNIYSKLFYKYWIESIYQKFIKKIYKSIENFDNLDEFRLSIFNLKKSNIIFDEKSKC